MRKSINSNIDNSTCKSYVYIKFCKNYNFGTTKFGIDSLSLSTYKIEVDNQQNYNIEIPEDADTMEIWSEVRALSEDKQLVYKSRPINKRIFDIPLSVGSKVSQMKYIAKCLKEYDELVPHVAGNAETPTKHKCVGYSTIAHPEFDGLYSRVQQLKEGDKIKVRVDSGKPETKFQTFTEYRSSVGGQKEQIYLYSQPVGKKTYYIGELREFDIERDIRLVKTVDGGHVIISSDEAKVIDPKNLDKYGYIQSSDSLGLD